MTGKVLPAAAVVVFACLIVALIGILVPLKWRNSDNLQQNGVKYLKERSANEKMSSEQDGKMNNEPSKNAKTYAPASKNGVDDLLLPQTVNVLMNDGRVDSMELEEYVTGCVLGEMPLDFESQALMAQSIAVRSFTARILLYGSSKHKNADVCTNPACCQNFILPNSIKISEENSKKLYDAVNATRGIIVVYDGQPIEAVYHAASGSGTLNSEDVWGGRVEYLRSVKAPEGELAVSASGLGHRVGMSQHGANILAKGGMNYLQILSYYYSGVSLAFM